MSSAPVSAGRAVLVAIQDAPLGLVRPFDSEQATRFEASLEALLPNTRRAYGNALAAWVRWAALQDVNTPGAYLQERAADSGGAGSNHGNRVPTACIVREGSGTRCVQWQWSAPV